MTRKLMCTLLLLGIRMIAQQPMQTENPVIPAVSASSELQDKAEGNDRIQSNLQSAFDDDPALSGAEIAANVDDESITLTGTVQSYFQFQRVLDLVSAYSSYRKVVDKVTVQ
jgi:osmotically-inducible protein OsmY